MQRFNQKRKVGNLDLWLTPPKASLNNKTKLSEGLDLKDWVTAEIILDLQMLKRDLDFKRWSMHKNDLYKYVFTGKGVEALLHIKRASISEQTEIEITLYNRHNNELLALAYQQFDPTLTKDYMERSRLLRETSLATLKLAIDEYQTRCGLVL